MKDLLDIFKALADRQRLRALMLLQGGELCVCQIIAVLGLAPSTVSKHLTVLKAAGLVEDRKVGRWVYYRWPNDRAAPAVRASLRLARTHLAGDDTAKQDRRALARVMKSDPEDLCRLQRPS